MNQGVLLLISVVTHLASLVDHASDATLVYILFFSDSNQDECDSVAETNQLTHHDHCGVEFQHADHQRIKKPPMRSLLR